MTRTQIGTLNISIIIGAPLAAGCYQIAYRRINSASTADITRHLDAVLAEQPPPADGWRTYQGPLTRTLSYIVRDMAGAIHAEGKRTV